MQILIFSAVAVFRLAQLESVVSETRLSENAQFSSYVSVFNELESRDAAADRAWMDLSDRAAYDAHRFAMRANLVRAMGGFPEKTPLNARMVQSYARQGYRIEKVIFESVPGLHVTANLFIPDDPKYDAPYPAVVMSCGHADKGKDCPTYLHACVLAARAGLVALMFDPVGQGERRDNKGMNSCVFHTQIGLHAALTGGSAAQIRTWDAIRAVDYVLSRPEVDPARVGYMGQSGGGTMTALMTAVDPRLRATAPSGYLTSLTALCEHMGPQDGEQNVFGQLAFGLNHTGYALIPDIPVAITCKFSDMFTYDATRRLYRLACEVADRVGANGRFFLNDAPGPHGWTESTESVSVDWLAARLAKKGEKRAPIDISAHRLRDLGFDIEADGELGLSPDERGCAPKGRTANLPDEIGIYAVLSNRLAAAAKTVPLSADKAARAKAVREYAKIRLANEVDVRVKDFGVEKSGAYAVRHLAFLYPNGLALPTVLVHADGARPDEVVVSVGRRGRFAALKAAEPDLRAGRAVLVADLTGLGSIGRGRFDFYGDTAYPEEGTSAMLYLMGESMVGRRATDLLVLADWLKRDGFDRIFVLAADDVQIAAAHAAAADPTAFVSVRRAGETFPSWRELADRVLKGEWALRYTLLVNGALRSYDWTEL